MDRTAINSFSGGVISRQAAGPPFRGGRIIASIRLVLGINEVT